MSDDPGEDAPEPRGQVAQRLDRWLWFARVTKSRTLAATLIETGKVRVNRARVAKPSHSVKAGDVVTIAVHRQIRVLKVVDGGMRRGPAKEAQGLYEDLTPPSAPTAAGGVGNGPAMHREPGSGRPTKRDRRATDRLKDSG